MLSLAIHFLICMPASRLATAMMLCRECLAFRFVIISSSYILSRCHFGVFQDLTISSARQALIIDDTASSIALFHFHTYRAISKRFRPAVRNGMIYLHFSAMHQYMRKY